MLKKLQTYNKSVQGDNLIGRKMFTSKMVIQIKCEYTYLDDRTLFCQQYEHGKTNGDGEDCRVLPLAIIESSGEKVRSMVLLWIKDSK